MPEEEANTQEASPEASPQETEFMARFQATPDFSALLITAPITIVIPIDVLIQCIQERAKLQQKTQLVVPRGRRPN